MQKQRTQQGQCSPARHVARSQTRRTSPSRPAAMPLPALTAMSSISLTAASLRPSLCARQLCATVALRCQLRAQKRFFVPTTTNGSSLQVQAICITCQTDRRASVLLLLCHMRRAVDGPGGGCLRHQSGSAHSEALRLGSQCSWLAPVLLRRASACPSGLPPPVSLGLALPALSCTPAKDHTTDHQTSLHPRSDSGTAGKRAGLHEVQLAGHGVEERVVAEACLERLQRCAQAPWAWTSRCRQSAAPLCAPLCEARPGHSGQSTSSGHVEIPIRS